MIPRGIEDVAPWPDWAAAAGGVTHFLHDHVGWDLWMVTRVVGEHQIVLCAQPEDQVRPGARLPWEESFCRQMVEGNAPRVATVTAVVPAYANLTKGLGRNVAAYLGVPIVAPDGSVHDVFGDVTVSNGLDWSPDGSLAYYDDTHTHRTDVFDWSAATGLTGRRPFVRFADDERPDGLTVDGDGGVWIAFYGGSAVRRYTADGRLDAVIELPTPNVTACTFGGPDLDQLFITTSAQGREGDPVAGSLFRADVGVRGMPVREFAG